MIGILHFSDLHISNEKNEILYLGSSIRNAILNELSKLSKVIVIISGDIAFKASKEEYFLAYSFLESLIENIKQSFNIGIEVIMVPGNHDCDFSSETEMRKQILGLILEDKKNITEPFIDECCKIQKNFFEFKSEFESEDLKTLFEDNLLSINKLDFESEIIYIIGINTAWISKLEEKPGEIFFPINKYIERIEDCDDGIIITTFHHPSKWGHPDDSNEFDKDIESLSDFILTGHEHYCTKFEKRGKSSNVVYIKAEALQKEDGMFKSGFSFILLDLQNKEYKYSEFDYINSEYKVVNDEEWTSYRDITQKKNNLIKLKKQTKTWLDDVGMNLKHPKKETLKNKDIFVYPDIQKKEIEKDESDIKEVTINSKEFFAEDFNNSVILYGEDKCGKTMLAKNLYLDFYGNKKFPLYIDGMILKKSNIYDVEKLLENIFQDQYEIKNDYKYLRDIEKENRIVIIDNLDLIDFNKGKKYKFLKEIISKETNIVCFCRSLFSLEDIIYDKEKSKLDLGIEEYEIKKFSQSLKAKLIHNWNIIGDRNAQYTDQFIIQDEEKSRQINTLMGKNYIPSLPFYILIILQASEAGNQHNFINSSYGYYYQYLILKTLNKISKNNGEIDAINNFLTALASKIYYEQSIDVEEKELEEFHNKFCREYRISERIKKITDFDEFMYNLCSNNILRKINDKYEFSYKYIYYYYIATYFSNNISNDSIREEISEMMNKLYIEEYANIIIFIVHLNKDDFILNKLIDISDNIFKEYDCIKFDKDIDFINKLQNEIPKLVVKNINPVEYRNKRLEDEDKLEKVKIKRTVDCNEEDDEEIDKEKLESINEVNLAFKSMEISGQILRNYWGSLTGEKKSDIGKRLYEVGLRSLAKIYDVLENAQKRLSRIIQEDLEKKYIDGDKKIDEKFIEKQSKEMVFFFAAYFANGMVNKITDCVGDRNLSETYEDIFKSLSYNSVKIINLCIKLSYSNGNFPEEEVKLLLKENEKNILVNFLIKHMVREFLYMYKIPSYKRERIAKLIGVSITDINLNSVKQSELEKK
ncbi:hypothetical protein C4D39_03170 [Clostridium perfringens]|nr:MAG TPA: metallophosphatase domain protein [Caudoviricetes sp.]